MSSIKLLAAAATAALLFAAAPSFAGEGAGEPFPLHESITTAAEQPALASAQVPADSAIYPQERFDVGSQQYPTSPDYEHGVTVTMNANPYGQLANTSAAPLLDDGAPAPR